ADLSLDQECAGVAKRRSVSKSATINTISPRFPAIKPQGDAPVAPLIRNMASAPSANQRQPVRRQITKAQGITNRLVKIVARGGVVDTELKRSISAKMPAGSVNSLGASSSNRISCHTPKTQHA